MWEGTFLSHLCTIEESICVDSITTPGRGKPTPERLEEHLQSTFKRLSRLGVCPGDRVASMLPDGPDAITARLAVTSYAGGKYAAIDPSLSGEQYQLQLLQVDPKLLLVHPGTHPVDHPVRRAARNLGIPVANVLRHFEAGVFTLEAAVAPPLSPEVPLPGRVPNSHIPGWKRDVAVPIVLIAHGPAYRRLVNRLDARHAVIGITPPSLEHLPPPCTIEHLAAECVRVLRRFRPQGPYALAGWRAEGLVAVEMARLLEEEGEEVAFVAMLDAGDLFSPPISSVRRTCLAALRLFRKKQLPACAAMADALRHYRPHPWYGKILHIGPADESSSKAHNRFEWRHLAPHGVVPHRTQGGMLADPGMQTVATILAEELGRTLVKA